MYKRKSPFSFLVRKVKKQNIFLKQVLKLRIAMFHSFLLSFFTRGNHLFPLLLLDLIEILCIFATKLNHCK